jgi:glutamate dehydrogenase (NAD(P)+)
VYCLREALIELGVDIKGTTASVQGFGNVSQYAIELYTRMGGKVVCVSSWNQAEQKSVSYFKAAGVDLDQLRAITDRFGGIDTGKAGALGYEILAGEAWLDRDVDILIPAAIENQITGANVAKIAARVKVIVEGANGPTTPEADAVIEKRGIFVIPDFLANAGGVTCSYFEQVQCNMNYFWERDDVLQKLDAKMTAAYHSISGLARKQKMYMRDAAYVVAINRVAEACKLRGWV